MLNQDLRDRLGRTSNLDLLNFLYSKNDGSVLIYDFIKIREKSIPLLKEIKKSFPEYTNHDIEHSDSVIQLLDEIIPEKLKDKLNKYELFFLLCSAILHDIGMVDFTTLIDENFKYSDKNLDFEQYLSEIRDRHNIRSESYLLKFYKDLAIDDIHQARIIGRICRGHRKDDLNDTNKYQYSKMYKAFPINVQLLSSLLRIADALDLTSGRAPSIVYEHCEPKNPLSVDHWNSHLSVSGVGIDPEHNFIIKADAICKDSKIHRNLKNLENAINEELENIRFYLHQYVEFRKELPLKFEINIESLNYDFYDLRFTLQDDKIIKILMGKQLYEREVVCIREVLKNSIDAFKFRAELKKKENIIIKPNIGVEVSQDKASITFYDNGYGMNKDILSRYFMKIGKSFYLSKEFQDKNLEFNPLGELGIGILSSFMIAEEIVIETKQENSDPLRLLVDDISDYFFITESRKEEVGTDTILNLSQDYIGKFDIKKELEYFARHLDIPISFIDEHSNNFKITDKGFLPNEESIEQWASKNVTFYTKEFKDENFQGKISFILSKKNGKLSTSLMRGWQIEQIIEEIPVLKYKYEHRNNFAFQGIFISNINDVLPAYLNKSCVWIDINFLNPIFDLNIARNNFIRNQKFRDLQLLLEDKLLDCYNSFINAFNRLGYESFINSLIGNIFEIHDLIDKMEKGEKVSEKLILLIVSSYKFKCIHNSNHSWLTISEIMLRDDLFFLNINIYWGDMPSDEEIESFIDCSDDYSLNMPYILSNSYYDYDLLRFFHSFKTISIRSLLKSIRSDIQFKFFPNAWKIYNLLKKPYFKFFEYLGYNDTIVNENHPFVKFLLDNNDVINSNPEIFSGLKGFFRDFKVRVKKNFYDVLKDQKSLIEIILAKANKKENLEKLMIKLEDL